MSKSPEGTSISRWSSCVSEITTMVRYSVVCDLGFFCCSIVMHGSTELGVWWGRYDQRFPQQFRLGRDTDERQSKGPTLDTVTPDGHGHDATIEVLRNPLSVG